MVTSGHRNRAQSCWFLFGTSLPEKGATVRQRVKIHSSHGYGAAFLIFRLPTRHACNLSVVTLCLLSPFDNSSVESRLLDRQSKRRNRRGANYTVIFGLSGPAACYRNIFYQQVSDCRVYRFN